MGNWLKYLALRAFLAKVEKIKRTAQIAGIVMGTISVAGFTALIMTRDQGPPDKEKISKKISKLLKKLTPYEQELLLGDLVDDLNKRQPTNDPNDGAEQCT